ncbi:helix-turn-helix domain-containing protein [Microbacterium sp.]|uniref:helix-turn-helix domain-containing protein n=1 Tax=Microbacterium sp. TaxID=51671 RepID=UPI0039E6BCF8
MDADGARAAKALSSPLRLRVLRLCRFEARTNKELAELLEVNPGTMLHHVRMLVETGFLQAQPERSGAQGAREVPYLATGLSWNAPMDDSIPVMLETIRQQAAIADPERVWISWLGLRLNDEHLRELHERMYALIAEYKDRAPDPDGQPYSLVGIIHPDLG